MRAIRLTRFGSTDVLALRDVPKPTIGDDLVLVRIRAASINRYDWHFMTGTPLVGRFLFGWLRPRVSGLGADLSGTVEAVGAVFGEVDGEVPGKPWLELGSFADYVCVSEESIVMKPDNLTFEEAGAAPLAGSTALRGLREQAALRRGQSLLVNGASGGVGTFAVQIGKALGATVTGVCSTGNLELVRSLGADEVIDYTTDDFVRSDRAFDVILDNVGNRPLSDIKNVLGPQGTYLASFGRWENRWFGPTAQLLGLTGSSILSQQKLLSLSMKRTRELLLDLKDLIESESVRPVIDRTYPLENVAEAMRYLEGGHARGKIVIAM
jgi:NADPH:quinone reductase-like Zn-dependent oxidoreductase